MTFNPIGLSDYERWAIHEFFLRVTLPILFRKDEHVGIIGNGTLFKIAGRSFLITAGHIMDDYPVADWAFPAHPRKGRSRGISTGAYVRPPDPVLDVCVVELQNPEVVATLDKNWKFLTLNNVWLPDLSANAILLAGYPLYERSLTGRTYREGFSSSDSNTRMATRTYRKVPIPSPKASISLSIIRMR